MFEWIDGHLLLAGLICPPAAYVIVWWLNERLRQRVQRQQNVGGCAR